MFVGPDLYPNRLTLMVFLKYKFEKKASGFTQLAALGCKWNILNIHCFHVQKNVYSELKWAQPFQIFTSGDILSNTSLRGYTSVTSPNENFVYSYPLQIDL